MIYLKRIVVEGLKKASTGFIGIAASHREKQILIVSAAALSKVKNMVHAESFAHYRFQNYQNGTRFIFLRGCEKLFLIGCFCVFCFVVRENSDLVLIVVFSLPIVT